MKLNIENILNNLKEYALSEKPINAMVLSVNQGAGGFKNRVFNSEAGTKDINGSGLGKYSNSYAKYRKDRGRQVAHVDLELTGSLRRDIKVISTESTVTCAIISPTERDKVNHLEKLYKKNIFDFSKEEQKEVNELLSNLITNDISNILNADSK
jgi:hypothetical protein